MRSPNTTPLSSPIRIPSAIPSSNDATIRSAPPESSAGERFVAVVLAPHR
jgi:hypothetical protein